MHKVRRCITFDDSAKKTRLLHGFNLALLGVLLCTTFSAGAKPRQNPDSGDTAVVKRTEFLSYEGQTISTVEVAGRPDINVEDFKALLALHGGDPFSTAKIDQSILALK